MEWSKSFNFKPSHSIDLLDQRKIVLACNIGHVSDISLHVYHIDRHKVLFHNKVFVFNTFFQNISTPASCVGYRLLWHRCGHGFFQVWHIKCNLPLTCAYSACLLTANICSLISLYIINHQECFKKIVTIGNFLQKSSAEKTKIATNFYVNATQVCKTQFHWSSRMEWPGINQSAMIFLSPCALAYDIMPFCVNANMTTGEVGCHLLINFPLFLTRDGRSMSATRCQHLTVSSLDAMSTRILGYC